MNWISVEDHNCIEEFKTRKIDECSGKGYNKCSGNKKMILDVWFEDKDGTECYFDNWISIEVKFCPFCGLESK